MADKMFPRRYQVTALTILILLATTCHSQQGGDIFRRRVAELKFHDVSRLDVILRLGSEYRIPLGIEAVDVGLLAKHMTQDFSGWSLGEALEYVVPKSEGYIWFVDHGTVVITNDAVRRSGKNPFDRIIPVFELRRPATPQEASTLVLMDLELVLDPSTRGFAGSIPAENTAHRVGPILLRGVTVRTCLDVIVGEFGQGAWIAGVPPHLLSKAPTSQLWRLVEYDHMPTGFSEVLSASPFFAGAMKNTD